MARHISRFMIIMSLALIAGLTGCSDPESNPVEPPSEFRDGTPLDLSADFIPASGSPYIVEQDWIIEEGRTVEIEAGTVIMVAGRNWIDIDGQLIAHGTPSSPIHFTSAHTSVDYGQWRGLKFDNPSVASELEHCIFTYGAFFDTDTLTERGQDAQHYRGMLAIRNSSPVIRHCICYFNQNNAVYIEGETAAPSIRYSILTENDASGVRADSTVNLEALDIAYNCVAENSAPPFIMGLDSTMFGDYDRVNFNIDSCDQFYNIDLPPLLNMPDLGWADESDFTLQSCSPCVDAGPFDPIVDADPDGTIADMGSIYYVRESAELRGRASGNLDAITYRLTCNIVVPESETLVIPAGCRIEATGDYEMRVLGQLRIDGDPSNRVTICNCEVPGNAVWSGIVFANREGVLPSELRNVDIQGFDNIDVFKPGTQFERVRFEDGLQYGVGVNTRELEGTPVRFQSCEFINCGTFALAIDSSLVTVTNTLIDGVKGRGIWIRESADVVVVRNCIVNACSTNALHLDNTSSPWIFNNVFSNSGYYGISMIGNCYPMVTNNIIMNNGRAGIYAASVSTPDLAYNDVYNNGMRMGSNEINYLEGGTGGSFLIPDDGSLTADPLLTAEFQLGAGSPCIDAGDPMITDGDGSRSDMGAFGGPFGGSVGFLLQDPNAIAVR